MLSDSYGNYRPGLEPGPTIGGSYGRLRHGEGPPDDSLGNNGDIYVDLSTGDVYQKTSSSYTIITGGGGGGPAGVFGSTVANDPNGVQSATGRAVFIGADGSIWYKNTAGTSNNEWQIKLT